MTSYKLAPGQALVLVGPQGCGKTTLAREIAARYGAYRETDVRSLLSPFQQGEILAGEPQTVIVEGFPVGLGDFVKIAVLVSSQSALCSRPMRADRVVITPNFIFCCDPAEPPPPELELDARRFRVINIKAAQS